MTVLLVQFLNLGKKRTERRTVPIVNRKPKSRWGGKISTEFFIMMKEEPQIKAAVKRAAEAKRCFLFAEGCMIISPLCTENNAL